MVRCLRASAERAGGTQRATAAAIVAIVGIAVRRRRDHEGRCRLPQWAMVDNITERQRLDLILCPGHHQPTQLSRASQLIVFGLTEEFDRAGERVLKLRELRFNAACDIERL